MRRIQPREEVCMACRLCQVRCQVEHSRSRHPIQAFREQPRPIPRIRVDEAKPISLAVACRHCSEPLCLYSCFAGALYRDPATGAVRVDAEKCVSCWTCIAVCPYGAVARDSGAIAKCDLCPHLATPACVSVCPNEALVLVEEDG